LPSTSAELVTDALGMAIIAANLISNLMMSAAMLRFGHGSQYICRAFG
jgi:hypothetical protein